jgi:hypothetical protein
MPHDTRTASAVDDIKGLAKIAFKQAGDDAGGGIRATTGAPRHNHLDRAAGITRLRQGRCCKPSGKPYTS